MPRLENCPPIFKVFQADDSTGVNNKVSALAGKLNLKEEKQKQVAISIKDLLKNNGADSNFKYHNYYAILQADGDRIGAKIVQAGTKEFKTKITIPMFEYVKQAVELVKNFGGRSIYAGGDDLLAIVPLKKELLTCCWNLAERFNTKMNSSLSFGLAIVYEKYPLYEALEIARNNLFQRAKKERNELSLTLIKHSGQTIEFDIDKFNQQDNNKMKIIMDGINMDTDEQFFTTAMHKCFQCKTLLDKAKREEKTDMVFKNVLDSEDKHGKDMSKQIGLIANVYKEFGADKFEYALRFIKFFHEKGKS
jgi:CRISPR-associated protein Cmr2